jgi:hypothetical protein
MTTYWRVKMKLLRAFWTWNLNRDVRFTSRDRLTCGKWTPGKPLDGRQFYVDTENQMPFPGCPAGSLATTLAQLSRVIRNTAATLSQYALISCLVYRKHHQPSCEEMYSWSLFQTFLPFIYQFSPPSLFLPFILNCIPFDYYPFSVSPLNNSFYPLAV